MRISTWFAKILSKDGDSDRTMLRSVLGSEILMRWNFNGK